jgi:hypothetical protein
VGDGHPDNTGGDAGSASAPNVHGGNAWRSHGASSALGVAGPCSDAGVASGVLGQCHALLDAGVAGAAPDARFGRNGERHREMLVGCQLRVKSVPNGISE